jgi:hypothetical protein
MELKHGGTNAVNQPGPLSAGAEYPSDAAWEAFFSAVWDAYEEIMRRRHARQTASAHSHDNSKIKPGA